MSLSVAMRKARPTKAVVGPKTVQNFFVRALTGQAAAQDEAPELAFERESARILASWRRRDDETWIQIYCEDLADRRFNVACLLVLRPGAASECRTGFSIDQFEYALPADVARLDEHVAVLSDFLDDELACLFAEAALARTLRDDWARCKARLEAFWRATEQSGATPDHLVIIEGYGNPTVGIGAPTTRLGCDDIVGVRLDGHEKFSHIHSGIRKHLIVAPSQELLAKMEELSGHQKLEILSGAQGALYRQARAAFEAINWKIPIARPTPRQSGIAAFELKEDSPELQKFHAWRADGGYALFYIGANCGKIFFTLTLKIAGFEAPILIKIDDIGALRRGGLLVIARKASEERYNDPQILDEHLRALLETVLAVDPDWPEIVTQHFKGEFDARHPLLAGLNVPPRHHAFFGAALGTPYAKAHAAAVKFAAKRAANAKTIAAVQHQPDQIPDGAIFGDIVFDAKGRPDKIKSYAHMGVVTTLSAPDAKRRKRGIRLILGAHGFSTARPLTPKNMAGLTRYDLPDALWFAPDECLGHNQRDIIEAAFRVSFELEPGAQNPLLREKATLKLLDFGPKRHRARITRARTSEGHTLLAIAIMYREGLNIPGDSNLRYYGRFDENFSGAAFTILTTPKGETVWARPSYLRDKLFAPAAEEKTYLAEAIAQLPELSSEQKAVLTGKLDKAWDALALEFAKT